MRLFSSFAIILGAFVAPVLSIPNLQCADMIPLSYGDVLISTKKDQVHYFYFEIDDPAELNVDISFSPDGGDVDFGVRHMVYIFVVNGSHLTSSVAFLYRFMVPLTVLTGQKKSVKFIHFQKLIILLNPMIRTIRKKSEQVPCKEVSI